MAFSIRNKKGITPTPEKKTKAKKSKETIWVDVDGTLAHYTTWKGIEEVGDVIDGAVEFMKNLSELGRVGIYTTRTNAEVNKEYDTAGLVDIIKNWCDDNDIYYDEIHSSEGKPIGSAYVDDRAVSCAPEKDNNAYENALESVKGLLASE